MPNIIEYLKWRGDIPFEISPFNEVDGVILSRVAYLPFEKAKFIFKNGSSSIGEVCCALLGIPDIEDFLLMKADLDLIKVLVSSPRFDLINVFGYINKRERKTQTQFAAVSFRLDESSNFVAYRGTDSTVVGWKEDFNMCFTCPIPSQMLAEKYLEKIASVTSGSLLVGGHSKGGNLAVYASACCPKAVAERIECVYNYDGPGFTGNIFESEGYGCISNKIKRYVPQASVVGMLLNDSSNYTTVFSSEDRMLFQHDVYSWDVKRDCFGTAETTTDGSKLVDSTLSEWLESMDNSHRELFIDTLYDVFSKTNTNSVGDIASSKLKTASVILKSYKNLDKETKKAVSAIIKIFMSNAVKVIKKPKEDE